EPGTGWRETRGVCAPVCPDLAGAAVCRGGGGGAGGLRVSGARGNAAADAAGAGRGPGSLHGGVPPAPRARGFALGRSLDGGGAGAAGPAAGSSAVTGAGDVPAGRADPAAASPQGGQAGVTAAWALCRSPGGVSAGGGGAGLSGAAGARRG